MVLDGSVQVAIASDGTQNSPPPHRRHSLRLPLASLARRRSCISSKINYLAPLRCLALQPCLPRRTILQQPGCGWLSAPTREAHLFPPPPARTRGRLSLSRSRITVTACQLRERVGNRKAFR